MATVEKRRWSCIPLGSMSSTEQDDDFHFITVGIQYNSSFYYLF